MRKYLGESNRWCGGKHLAYPRLVDLREARNPKYHILFTKYLAPAQTSDISNLEKAQVDNNRLHELSGELSRQSDLSAT